MLSPISINTPHSIINAVTPGDYRRKRLSKLTIPTSKDIDMDMSWDVTTPMTPCSEQDEEESGSTLHHSMSNLSMDYTSDEHDTDYEDDEDYMSTSTSPATSDWESPVSSPSVCLSPVSIPSPCRPRATSSRPWSGCLSCDNPHVGRPCTQALLLCLATESCRSPAPIVSPTCSSHTCTSSCTHHSRHIHYERPAYLRGMTLNPAGFVRVPLPETSDDTESTTLGQRRLGLTDKSNTATTAAATTPMIPRRTSISSGPAHAQTPLITPRRASVFTFASTPETIEIPAPTASTISSQSISAETPRIPKRHSISNITIPQSICAPSKSCTFVPLPVLRSASSSPSFTPSPSHAMCLSPAIDAVSELDISIEVPTVRMSPIIYATRQQQQQQQQQQQHEVTSRHMQRTSSSNAIARTEEGRGFMSPPLPSSAIIPEWHNKSKYNNSFHHVRAPVSRKYQGVLPGASTCTSTLPSSWTQPKLFMLYLFYLALNAAFVLVLHH